MPFSQTRMILPLSIFSKRFICIGVITLALVSVGKSQDFNDFLETADRYAAKGDHQNAIDNYLSAERLNPGNAEVNYKLGKAYLTSHYKHKALEFLLRVYAVQPNHDDEINYYVGEAYQYNHNYVKAKEQYELFKQKNKKLADVADFRIEECVLGDSLVKNPLHVAISNMGPGINSVYDDYSPLIAHDGSKFIFTSNRKTSTETSNKKGPTIDYEDIFIAKPHDGTWTTPEKISPNINIPFHDAAASISHDGNTLFLYYEVGAGDIFSSTFDGVGWSKAKPLNKNINTTYWETSACISSDGKKLYYTSNRPGGYGELDIYVSELGANGEWGKGINLGPNVNTHGNEDAPFIHSDGVTLYFGSNGHVGLGEHDIFKSEFKNGKWQKAKNLGYPVNSADYENFYVVSDDNKTAYFCSSREDRIGNIDIYKVNFLERKIEPQKPLEVIPPPAEVKHEETHRVVVPETIIAKEEPKEPVQKTETAKEEFVDPMVHLQKEMKNVTILKGKVIDAASAKPLGAKITLIDNEKNIILAKISSNEATGDFEIIIPHGGNYGVATELNGYLFNSINFNLPNFSEYMELDTHILMQKAEVGSKVVLKNVFFDSGKSDLKTQSLSELENIHELLITNPELNVQINGHTDNTGKAAYNKALSLKRAQSVVDYLIHHGIAPSRLSAVGYGPERPLVSNDDETQGREINRRTEIEIIDALKK